MAERLTDFTRVFLSLSEPEIYSSWSGARPISWTSRVNGRPVFDPLSCIAGLVEIGSLEDWGYFSLMHQILRDVSVMTPPEIELETDHISGVINESRISPEGVVQLVHGLAGIAIGVFSLGLGISPNEPKYDLDSNTISIFPDHFFLDFRKLLSLVKQLSQKTQNIAISHDIEPVTDVFDRLLQLESSPNEKASIETGRQHDRFFNHTSPLNYGTFKTALACFMGTGEMISEKDELTKRSDGARIFWSLAGHSCFRGSEEPIINIFDWLLGKDSILALSFLGCAVKSGHLSRVMLNHLRNYYEVILELSSEDKMFFFGPRPDLSLDRIALDPRPSNGLVYKPKFLTTGAFRFPYIHSGHLGALNLMALEQDALAYFVPTKYHSEKPGVNPRNFPIRCALMGMTAGSWPDHHIVTASIQPDPPIQEDVFMTYEKLLGSFTLVVGGDKPLDPEWIKRMLTLTGKWNGLTGLKVLARIPSTNPNIDTSGGILEKTLNRALDLGIPHTSLVFAPGMTYSSTMLEALYRKFADASTLFRPGEDERRNKLLKWSDSLSISLDHQQVRELVKALRKTILGVLIPLHQAPFLGLTEGESYQLPPRILKRLGIKGYAGSV